MAFRATVRIVLAVGAQPAMPAAAVAHRLPWESWRVPGRDGIAGFRPGPDFLAAPVGAGIGHSAFSFQFWARFTSFVRVDARSGITWPVARDCVERKRCTPYTLSVSCRDLHKHSSQLFPRQIMHTLSVEQN